MQTLLDTAPIGGGIAFQASLAMRDHGGHDCSPRRPQQLASSFMATKKAEDGIRAYLDGLGKTSKPIVDKEAVKALKAEIRTAGDPIAKLRLLAALEEAEQGVVPDTAGDEAVFVAEARAWADAEGIPGRLFSALGVPDDVLKAAGFPAAELKGAAPSKARTSSARAPRLALEDVQAVALGLKAPWKLTDLAAAVERDAATARNYVAKLVEGGKLKDLGDDPAHNGRGRAPRLYGPA